MLNKYVLMTKWMKLRLKILLLLLVVKQVRAKGWDTIHVAPKLALFLAVYARDNTGRSRHCPVLRCVWLRKEKLTRGYVSLPAPECRCSRCCGSPSVPFFALHSPSYGTEIRRGLALELLLSVEMFTAGETGGAEGIAVEVSVRDPGAILKSLICVCLRYSPDPWKTVLYAETTNSTLGRKPLLYCPN